MKYLYYDLGEQQQDTCVVAHLRGSAANVILIDPVNFDRYRLGQLFQYTGGLQLRTPVRLRVPQTGHWYLVVDCGGYQHHVHARHIEIVPPDESPTLSESDTTLAGAST